MDMDINYGNIPKAIGCFIVGTFVNIMLYYILSPNEVDMIGIFDSMGLFTMEAGTKAVIWGGIMVVCIVISLAYPIWMIFDTDEE